MATLQEVKIQLAQAESQLAQQRQSATLAQTKSAQQLRQLETAQQKLPSITSQMALRQKMGGLAGQLKRKAIAKVKERIFGQKAGIEKYKQDIASAQARLQSYEETQLAPVRQQIKETEAYNLAVERVEKAADRGNVGLLAAYGEGLVKRLAEKYLKTRSIERESFSKQIAKFEAERPGEKLIIDWKKMQVKGVQSGSLGQTISLKEYNKSIGRFKPTELDSVELKEIPMQTITLAPEQALVQPTFLQKLKGAITGAVISKVSALPSSSRDLSSRDTSRIDDISISTRVLDRKRGGLDVITPIRDKFSSIGTDIFKGAKEGFQKEIFDPKTGTFQTVSAIPQLEKGTIEVLSSRFPTTQEQSKIDVLQKYAVTTDIPTLKQDVKRLEGLSKVQKGFTSKYADLTKDKVDAQGYFIGTDKELEKVNRLYSQIEFKQKQIEAIQPTRTSSFFGYEREVPIQRLGTGFGFINTQFGTIAKATGQATSKLGREGGYITIPGRTAEIYEPQFGTIQRGVSGYKDIAIPETVIGTPSQLRKAGEIGVYAAGYLTPYLGVGLGASEVGESFSEVDYSPKRFIKEKPGEALLLGGLALGAGAFRGAKYLKQVKPEFQIFSREAREGLGVISKPTKQIRKGGTTVTEYPLLGTSQTVEMGRKTILKTRGQDIMNKIFGGDRAIYKGAYKLDKEGYKKALEKLINQGYTKSAARNILREVKPKVTEDVFAGLGQVVESEEGLKLIVKGAKKSIPIKTEVGGVETGLKKSGEFRLIESVGVPAEIKGVEDLYRFKQVERKSLLDIGKPTLEPGTEGALDFAKRQLRRKDLIPYSKLDQAGRTTETFDILSGSRILGKGKIPTKRISKDFDIFKMREIEVYQESGILRKTIPKQKKLISGKSKVVIEKGKPEIVYDIDEMFGVDELKGATGRGDKSSAQFLKQLYGEGEAGLATGLKTIVKPKVIPLKAPTIKRSTPRAVLETPTPSAYAGTGLYERTEITAVSPRLLSIDSQPALIERDVLSFQPRVSVAVGLKEFQPTKQRDVLSFRQETKLKSVQESKIKIREAQKFDTSLRFDTKQRQAIVQKTRQETRQETRPSTRVTTRPEVKPRVKIKPPLTIPLPLAKPKKRRVTTKLKKKRPEEFLGITKRKGKEVIVGIGRTAEEAEFLTKKDVLGTLGATVKVVEKRTGRQVQLTGDRIFKISKMDPLAIVQRKTRRLAATSERKAIAKSRKKGRVKRK